MEGSREERIQGDLRQSHMGIKIHTQRDLVWNFDVLPSHVEAIIQGVELLYADGSVAQRSQDCGHAIQIGRDKAWAGVYV